MAAVVAGFRSALGDAHPDTLGSINNLGMLLQAQGRLDEARPLLEEAVAGRRAGLGDARLVPEPPPSSDSDPDPHPWQASLRWGHQMQSRNCESAA